MSRAHKILDTWFKNREVQQRYYSGQNKPAEKPADKEPEKKPVKEAIDKEHPIYKEYQGLKKHDIKTLRGIIKGQHRIVDTSEFRTKEHAISHILHNKHGAKRMAAVFGESAQIDELKASTLQSYANKAHQQSMDYAYDAAHQYKDKEAQKKSSYMAQKRAGGVERAQTKLDKMKEDVDLDEAVKIGSKVTIHAPGKSYHGITGTVGEIRHGAYKGAPKTYTVHHGENDAIQLDKKNIKLHKEDVDLDEGNKSKPAPMSHTQYDAHDREERQMRNLVSGREGGVQKDTYKHAKKVGVREDMDVTKTFFSLVEGLDAVKKQQRLRDALDRHTEKSQAAAKAGNTDAVRVHQSYMNKIKKQMDRVTRNESIEDIWDTSELKLDEAWNQGSRNPQRGIKVGHQVRSYDFPGMHDDHYIEGHVVGETPSTYHIKVNKVIRSGKEIPTPAHMHHVEAPKGRSIWTDAYAVHKIKDNKAETVANKTAEPAGAAKTFNKVRGKR